MRPEVLYMANMGCVFLSTLMTVGPLALVEIPRLSGCRALVSGVGVMGLSQGMALWLHVFYGMGAAQDIAVWWWVGGIVLLLGIFMLTHGVIRRHIPALSMGVIAFIVGCLWR